MDLSNARGESFLKSSVNISTSAAKTDPKNISRMRRFLKQLDIQTMVWPGILLMILFSYLPMYGVLIAFKDYDIGVHKGIVGIFQAPWAGLKYFEQIFNTYNVGQVLLNTVGINILGTFIGFPIPIIFALLLNEMTHIRFKKFTQTVSYLPHFISWAIYGGIIISILSPDSGVLNYILLKAGLIQEPILFMGEPKYFWWMAILTNLMKELGWSAILYISAITSIDQTLYEAATVDGAGRFQKMWHITLSGISGTIVIMLIISISGFVRSRFDQIWVLQNSLNVSASETIDTYVYKIGIGNMRFSFSAALGLFRSVVAVILLSMANFISRRVADKGLY